MTQHQYNIMRHNQSSIVRAQAAGGTQQFRAQKILTTPEQIRAQQLGKHPQKVITQQLLVPVRGGQVMYSSVILLLLHIVRIEIYIHSRFLLVILSTYRLDI